MTSQYKITPEEYVEAGLLNGEIRGFAKKTHLFIEALMITASLVFAYMGNYILASGLFGGVIGVYLIPFLFRKFYTPRYLKRHYSKYPTIQKPMSISVTEGGIKFTNENGEGTVVWHDIHKWRSGKELILIYPAPRIYYMVPKRLPMTSGLYELLQNKVGKET